MPIQPEPTITPAIILSEVSLVAQGGKRSLINIFDQFAFPQFPATVGRFFATGWIANLAGTVSELELTCRIEMKGSAHVIFSSATKLQFSEEQKLDGSTVMGLSVPVGNITFQNPGIYTIVFLLNGEKVGERDFSVLLVSK